MVREYTAFTETLKEQKCPYCGQEAGNLILHQFKCEDLYRNRFIQENI